MLLLLLNDAVLLLERSLQRAIGSHDFQLECILIKTKRAVMNFHLPSAHVAVNVGAAEVDEVEWPAFERSTQDEDAEYGNRNSLATLAESDEDLEEHEDSTPDRLKATTYLTALYRSGIFA